MMSRRGADWITNVNRGAVPELVSGHDRGRAGGARSRRGQLPSARISPASTSWRQRTASLLVLEVNSMPAWSGLQSVAAVNIADAIAEALLAFLADRDGDAASRTAPASFRRAGEFVSLMLSRERIQAAYEEACRREIEALKPGNVHRFRRRPPHVGPTSSSPAPAVSSAPLTDPDLARRPAHPRSGPRDTRDGRDQHQSRHHPALRPPRSAPPKWPAADFPVTISARSSTGWTSKTPAAVFEAIVLASPGGLGSADAHDVRRRAEGPPARSDARGGRTRPDRPPIRHPLRRRVRRRSPGPRCGARRAARAACGRPSSPTWRFSAIFRTVMWRASTARKSQTAYDSRPSTSARRWSDAPDEAARIDLLMQFDRGLKARAVNPGTSADLTVACLLVHILGVQLA